jgi:hypothetical protein
MSKIESPSFGRGKISTSMAQAQPFQKGKRGRPPGSKNKPKVKVKTHVVTHPIIESTKAEINEAIELQRAHFPNDDEVTLRHRAEQFRAQKWKEGRWPDFAAVAKREADEKAAVEAAERAAAEAKHQGGQPPTSGHVH